jgi:hypothetical protein
VVLAYGLTDIGFLLKPGTRLLLKIFRAGVYTL